MNDIDLIEQYLDGSLSEAERFAFEERLRLEAELRAQVEEMKLIREGILRASRKEAQKSLQALEATLPAVEAPLIPLWRNTWLQVAAGISLLAALVYLLWPSSRQEQALLATQFEVYPNIVMPTLRGSQNNDSTTKALAFRAYDQKQYEEAIRLFEALTDKDDTILFYLGNAYLASQQAQKALSLFEQVLNHSDVFDEQAAWYIAVCYLKMEEREKAKASLKQVMEQGGAYAAKAQDVLKKLN